MKCNLGASLAAFTNEELIEELFARSTLVGAMIYSPANHRYDKQAHNHFRVCTTMTNDDSIFVLSRAIEELKDFGPRDRIVL